MRRRWPSPWFIVFATLLFGGFGAFQAWWSWRDFASVPLLVVIGVCTVLVWAWVIRPFKRSTCANTPTKRP